MWVPDRSFSAPILVVVSLSSSLVVVTGALLELDKEGGEGGAKGPIMDNIIVHS